MAHTGNGTSTLYAKLEDRYLERDQVGATLVFHDLVRAVTRQVPREDPRARRAMTENGFHVIYGQALSLTIPQREAALREGVLILRTHRSAHPFSAPLWRTRFL